MWSEENRFDTHFNELDGYQQSHRWCPISHQWVVTKKVDQKWLIERQETLSLLNSMRTQKRASHEWWSWKNPLSLDRPSPMELFFQLHHSCAQRVSHQGSSQNQRFLRFHHINMLTICFPYWNCYFDAKKWQNRWSLSDCTSKTVKKNSKKTLKFSTETTIVRSVSRCLFSSWAW